MLQTAIWDFDGTLYDTYPLMMQALQQALGEHQIKIDAPKLYRQIKEKSITSVVHQLEQTKGITGLLARYHELESQLQQHPQPFADALSVCQAVVTSGGQNFLLTHRDQQAKQFLTAGGFTPLFSGYVTSEFQFKRKPNPEALNYLITRYQLDKATTIMIGDRPLDVIAGQKAGVKSCFFDVDGFHNVKNATITINALAQLIPYFHEQA